MKFQQALAKRNSTLVLASVALLLVLRPVAALAVTPNELYQRGLSRYQVGDYLGAAENLFAFLQVAPSNLTTDFRNQVDEALRFSEERVMSITISSSGKADDASAKGTRENRPSRPKPRLPQTPAHTTAALKGKMNVMARPAFKTTAPKALGPPAATTAEVDKLKRTIQHLKGRLAECQQKVSTLQQQR